ncbi:MAG: DNA/RNA non-specific endonuclease, partial [Pseudomonadota bacterium]
MKKRQPAQRSRTRSKFHLFSTGVILALGLSCHSCTHLPAAPVQEAATRLEDFARELGTALRERANVPTSKSESSSTQGAQTGGANSFAECPQFFAEGRPPVVASGPTNRELCFDAFAILHSGESKTPVFVAQKLNRASVKDAGEERTNRFYAEARLRSAERATLEDYKTSGYDRGHMAPAGDMPTPRAMAQSFSLANMIPQAPEHNRGTWAKSVEMATRKYASRAAGDVYVITGP